MKAKMIDFAVGIDGKQRLTLALEDDFRSLYDELHDEELDVTVKKFRRKRSLDANAMMWAYCSKIAYATGVTKEEVYRRNIKDVGQYTPLPIREDAVDEFLRIWSEHGTGWFTEIVDDSKIPGYKLVFAYHGSSTYDTKAMSHLIDNVLQDAKSVGIDTLSERERSLLLDAWA